jgi:hypothetical protein
MSRQVIMGLYVTAMIALIVGVDLVFLRNRFWERLTVNVGIVLVFWSILYEILEASMTLSEWDGRAAWRMLCIRIAKQSNNTSPQPL